MFKILSICKGGGYRYCRTDPPHPNQNRMGLYPLHRVLMENKIGRLLRSDEIVHHKDENKQNDNIDNLEIMFNSEHSTYHGNKKAPPKVELKCPYCNKEFSVKPHEFRVRIGRNKSKKVFCSRFCSGSFQHVAK